MRKLNSLVVGLLAVAAVTAHAQTAQIVALSPADAEQAKYLFLQKQEIEKSLEAFKVMVVKKYPFPEGAALVWRYHGGDAIEFSTDYKFITPKVSYISTGYGLYNCPAYYTAPANSDEGPKSQGLHQWGGASDEGPKQRGGSSYYYKAPTPDTKDIILSKPESSIVQYKVIK